MTRKGQESLDGVQASKCAVGVPPNVASQAAPSWNQIAAFLKSIRQL